MVYLINLILSRHSIWPINNECLNLVQFWKIYYAYLFCIVLILISSNNFSSWTSSPITILQQADNFCNSIGILQQCALPSKFSNFDRNGSQTPQQQEGIYIYIY